MEVFRDEDRGGSSTEDSKYVAYCLGTGRKKNSHPSMLFSVRKTKAISMCHDWTYTQDNQLHKYMYINI